MEETAVAFDVCRAGDEVAVIAIEGDVTPAREGALMHAYGQAIEAGASAIVLDFTDLTYMNSGGIGLLVTLLVRARGKHRLLACGLSEHYRQILSLTRLDEAIEVHPTQSDAVAAT